MQRIHYLEQSTWAPKSKPEQRRCCVYISNYQHLKDHADLVLWQMAAGKREPARTSSHFWRVLWCWACAPWELLDLFLTNPQGLSAHWILWFWSTQTSLSVEEELTYTLLMFFMILVTYQISQVSSSLFPLYFHSSWPPAIEVKSSTSSTWSPEPVTKQCRS